MDIKTRKLSIIERITRIESEKVIEQIDALLKQEDFELSEEHREMLDERLESHRLDPKAGSSWQEVKERAYKNISSSLQRVTIS